ncbi:MAG: hypothetical protein LQ343_003766 [Gyalolechia ehrenbergii]|nr:MAG: hypothetical protein LQ343_003766 [Gyalolechia ehrenbergii]
MALANMTTLAAALFNATLGNIEADWVGGQVACAQFYGTFAGTSDCIKAANKLPIGADERVYHISTMPHYYFRNRMPMSRQHGNCMVQVEMAGKRTPPTVRLVPDDIRRVAAYIIETCALERGGPTGGFGTGNLEDMKQWLATDGISLDHSIPYYTSFPTITFSNPFPEYFSPGNFDLEMALYFSRSVSDAAKLLPPNSRQAKALRARATRLMRVQQLMDPRGKRIPWWSDPDRPPRLGDAMPQGNATEDATEGVLVPPGGGPEDGAGTARKERRKRGKIDKMEMNV